MVDHILERVPGALSEPVLEQIATQAKAAVELAFIKVMAHVKDPAAYPMPRDPNAFEGILLERLRHKSEEKQQRAVRRAGALLDRTRRAEVQRFRRLSAVELGSAEPVLEQAARVGLAADMRIKRADFERLLAANDFVIADDVAAPPGRYDQLELRIRRVKCHDETNPETGHDRIYLGGIALDATGDVYKIAPFKVGEFDDGDVVSYSTPKRFAMFDMRTGGSEMPRTYTFAMILAEKDGGNFPDQLERLLHQVKDHVAALVAAGVGAAIGANAGPIGALVGAIVGLVLGGLISLLIKWWEDDLFPEVSHTVTIRSYDHLFASGKHTSGAKYQWTAAHKGKYGIWYDFRVFP